MIEHPTKRELDEYRRRVIPPAQFLSVHRHVIACPHCAAQCNSTQQLGRDLVHLHEALVSEPAGTPYHLSPAEMVACARGALDEIDLEIAESHLGICSACLNEVQRHRAEIERSETPQVYPSTVETRRRFVTWPWRAAAAVLGVSLLILFAFWLLQTRPAKHKDQAAQQANPSSTHSPSAQVQNRPEGSPAEAVVPNTQFAVVLDDGDSKVTMDSHGTLAGLEQLSPHIQLRIKAALQASKLEQPAILAQLNSQPGTLLGESGNGLPFRLLSPLGQVVRSQQPTFRWQTVPGAQSYKIFVTDADLNEVATSPALNATEWRITQPLKRGGIYSWQVTALRNGVAISSPVLPAPQAKFRILDRSTLDMMEQAERAEPHSHLTRGVLYAEAGMLDKAEEELHLLVRQNPRADIAHKLLRSVQAMRADHASSSGRG